MRLQRYFGPSTLVAAAFIGPGTLTTCTIVGVRTGYGLLWAMAFSTVATLILQEMAARLGFSTQRGLGEALRSTFSGGLSRIFTFFMVIGAILVGNAAYEAGNLSGGVLGLELLVGPSRMWGGLVGLVCGALLYFGGYRWLEKVLIALVLLMSLCFLLTAILVRPDWAAVLTGFIPNWNSDVDLLLILGLIGTTVVPYNLFLHAATISKKYDTTASLRDIRIENTVAVLLGGLISTLIIITAAGAANLTTEVASAADLATQLQPLAGEGARYLMGVGLLAAGISSALTAPIAAAYAARGLFGWSLDEIDPRFRLVWVLVLIAGIAVVLSGVKSILIIKFAQITNALLLPVIAVFLLKLANSRHVMGANVNTRWSNFLGGTVLLITLALAVRTLIKVFGM